MTKSIKPIHIIGGGMAGSEAAWQAASMGVPVILHEMRPVRGTEAHKTDGLAELVCSNSFRSDDKEANAVGVLHEEMRMLDSVIIEKGDKHAVPAGGALAVDRDAFSQDVTQTLDSHPLITIERGEVTGLPPVEWENCIIATGPLTSEALANDIRQATGEDALAFFDAIAPIIHKDSIDFDKAWFQSRYDKEGPAGTGKDYINCPMTQDQYYAFIDALLAAEKMEFKEWEKNTPYFEGCMPIEVMAARGRETLSFGPMKPVGLTNPHDPAMKLYAVVQLRQDNALGTLYNMVGFQTKMKYGAQVEVLRTIPGLEKAEFARLGGIHRNTFINSPKLLDESLRLRHPRGKVGNDLSYSGDPESQPPAQGGGDDTQQTIRFAGQITGCEGYVESAGVGLMAGRFAAAERLGLSPALPPRTTAIGSLLAHITGEANNETFQPMNINFGLMPLLDLRNAKGKPIKGLERKKAMAKRALDDMQTWANSHKQKVA